MKAKAAVAWAPAQPLSIEEIDVEGPKEGEVLLKVVASGVCHTMPSPCPGPTRRAPSPACWTTRAAVRSSSADPA